MDRLPSGAALLPGASGARPGGGFTAALGHVVAAAVQARGWVVLPSPPSAEDETLSSVKEMCCDRATQDTALIMLADNSRPCAGVVQTTDNTYGR